MEKVGSFFYGLGAFIAGGLLMVAGWWISMLNIRVDNFQDPDFTSFWTLFGLAMIFIGAYVPFMVVGLRGRFVRKRQELDQLNKQYAAEHAAAQSASPGAGGSSSLPGRSDSVDPTER